LNTLFQLTAATVPPAIELVTPQDALLFRQDACYLLQSEQLWPTTQLYALASDVAFRHLNVHPSIFLIDDLEWVRLCAAAKRVISC
jgi:sulfur relay protein TusB/DsrH